MFTFLFYETFFFLIRKNLEIKSLEGETKTDKTHIIHIKKYQVRKNYFIHRFRCFFLIKL